MSTNNNADARSELITKATELRSQGKSLREIGKALGISTTSAHYMLKGTKRPKRKETRKRRVTKAVRAVSKDTGSHAHECYSGVIAAGLRDMREEALAVIAMIDDTAKHYGVDLSAR